MTNLEIAATKATELQTLPLYAGRLEFTGTVYAQVAYRVHMENAGVVAIPYAAEFWEKRPGSKRRSRTSYTVFTAYK